MWRQEPSVGPLARADFLTGLCSHRWALPLLPRLASGRGRVIELAVALGASRGGVRQALEALITLDLAVRNTGHGHPLRPEFVLTPRGRRLAGIAGQIVVLTDRLSIQNCAFRKWPLPIIHSLGARGARFSELRRRLPGITDRSLSAALVELEAARLADRVISTGRPPTVEYLPTQRAGELRPLLTRLVAA
jgi:DNA-binding HxlR family transcriptional regulator